MPVWRQGITGRGVVVSILDDGVDHTHPDLRDNFVSGRVIFDIIDDQLDPIKPFKVIRDTISQCGSKI